MLFCTPCLRYFASQNVSIFPHIRRLVPQAESFIPQAKNHAAHGGKTPGHVI